MFVTFQFIARHKDAASHNLAFIIAWGIALLGMAFLLWLVYHCLMTKPIPSVIFLYGLVLVRAYIEHKRS